MQKGIILGILLSFLSFSLKAQIERSIFSAYEVDSITQIEIHTEDSAQVEFWPGDNILVETNIALYGSNTRIFDDFIKKKRYHLIGKKDANRLILTSNPALKKKITGPDGSPCDEVIERKIYIPESYVLDGNAYVRAKEDNN